MKVKELKERERPREKALQYGISSLSNRELVALLLRSGTREHSALEIADEVLMLKGSLGELGGAGMQELMGIHGIKQAKALEVSAAFELGRRIAFDKVRSQSSIEQPEDIIEWLNQEIGYAKQEHFLVLFLDQKNHILCYRTMFVGTLTAASVHPREIFREAMQQNCAKILCVHNHPSGDPTPSEADIALTKVIEDTGNMVAIPLIDHIIVARNSYISFRQKELMH